MIPKW